MNVSMQSDVISSIHVEITEVESTHNSVTSSDMIDSVESTPQPQKPKRVKVRDKLVTFRYLEAREEHLSNDIKERRAQLKGQKTTFSTKRTTFWIIYHGSNISVGRFCQCRL
jgi:hypothetical protein